MNSLKILVENVGGQLDISNVATKYDTLRTITRETYLGTNHQDEENNSMVVLLIDLLLEKLNVQDQHCTVLNNVLSQMLVMALELLSWLCQATLNNPQASDIYPSEAKRTEWHSLLESIASITKGHIDREGILNLAISSKYINNWERLTTFYANQDLIERIQQFKGEDDSKNNDEEESNNNNEDEDDEEEINNENEEEEEEDISLELIVYYLHKITITVEEFYQQTTINVHSDSPNEVNTKDGIIGYCLEQAHDYSLALAQSLVTMISDLHNRSQICNPRVVTILIKTFQCKNDINNIWEYLLSNSDANDLISKIEWDDYFETREYIKLIFATNNNHLELLREHILNEIQPRTTSASYENAIEILIQDIRSAELHRTKVDLANRMQDVVTVLNKLESIRSSDGFRGGSGADPTDIDQEKIEKEFIQVIQNMIISFKLQIDINNLKSMEDIKSIESILTPSLSKFIGNVGKYINNIQ